MNKCLQWISLTALQMALIVFPWDSPRNNTCVKVSTNKSLAERSKSCVCFKHICKPLQQMASLCLPLQTVQTQRNCWTGVVLLTEWLSPSPAELWSPAWSAHVQQVQLWRYERCLYQPALSGSEGQESKTQVTEIICRAPPPTHTQTQTHRHTPGQDRLVQSDLA